MGLSDETPTPTPPWPPALPSNRDLCQPAWLLLVPDSAAGPVGPAPRALPSALAEAVLVGAEQPGRTPGPAVPLGLASGPRRPAMSRQPPPPQPAAGRVQRLKIALEETQVWGWRRGTGLGRAARSAADAPGAGTPRVSPARPRLRPARAALLLRGHPAHAGCGAGAGFWGRRALGMQARGAGFWGRRALGHERRGRPASAPQFPGTCVGSA